VTAFPFPCEFCHKQYASKTKLKQHKAKDHADLAALDKTGDFTEHNTHSVSSGTANDNVVLMQVSRLYCLGVLLVSGGGWGGGGLVPGPSEPRVISLTFGLSCAFFLSIVQDLSCRIVYRLANVFFLSTASLPFSLVPSMTRFSILSCLWPSCQCYCPSILTTFSLHPLCPAQSLLWHNMVK